MQRGLAEFWQALRASSILEHYTVTLLVMSGGWI